MPESATASAVLKLSGAIIIGSIPFSNIVSHKAAGQDLRQVSTGTVSPTSVYRVAGAFPFAIACLLECGKGAAVATTVRRSGPALAAVAAGLTVAGHNWSPFLKGAGGRGVLPTMGFLLVTAPQGAGLFTGAVTIGYLIGDSAPACLAAQVLLVPVLRHAYGKRGLLLAVAVTTPMLVKRLLGNHRPGDDRLRDALLARLVFDRDRR